MSVASKIKIRTTFLVLALVVGVAACDGESTSTTTLVDSSTTTADGDTTTTSDSAEPPADRPELRVRLSNQDVQTLDPAFINNQGSQWVADNVYSRLLSTPTGNPDDIVGDLATSWEVSDDGLVYDFTLREGVQFHKGYGELTAHDVKFSFERIMDPATESRERPHFETISEIQVIDDYNLRIIMSEPYAPFLTSVLPWRVGGIVSEKAVTEMGVDEHALNPIGTGPFVFESWTPGQEVYISANDDYYAGPPQVSGVRMFVIPDESVAAIALENGEIHLAVIESGATLDSLEANPDIVIEREGSTAARTLYANTKSGPLSDPDLRRALSYAVDQKVITDTVFDGWHDPLYTLLPPSLLYWTDDVELYDYNPDLSRQLLAEAGYGDGVTFTILHTQRPIEQAMAVALQEMFRAVGADAELIGLDHPVYGAERAENREAYDFVITHTARSVDPHSYLQDTVYTPVSTNVLFDGVDDLIEEGKAEPDPERRAEIYREIQTIMADEAIAIPLSHTTYTIARRVEVQGWIMNNNLGFNPYSISIAD